MKQALSLAVLVVLVAGGVAAQDTTMMQAPAPSLSVEAVVARDVMDRMPVDSGIAFPADVGTLVCWTRVTGAAAGVDTELHHVWFHGDQQVGDMELRVGGSPWRTWSRKTVVPEWTGPWRVEVRDASGTVLATVSFTVGM
jgi:hypothetical protein